MSINDIGIGVFAILKWTVTVSLIKIIIINNTFHKKYFISQAFIEIDQTFEVINSWLFKGFVTVSLFTSIGIAVDRYLAIAYPLYYRTNSPRNLTIVFIILSWIYALANCTLSLFNHSEKVHHCSCTILCVISFITFVTSNIGVYQVLHSYQKKMNFLDRKIKRELRLMKTMRLMFLVYFIFYCPYFIMQHLQHIVHGIDDDVLERFRTISGLSIVLSCLMNSIVYGWQVRVIRNEIKKLFVCSKTEYSIHTEKTLTTLDDEQSRNQ